MQQQWIISQSDCDVWWKVDFIWQLVTASSVIGPRRSSKALPKAKLAPKKLVLITVWWSAACLIHYSYLNPDEAITSEKYAQQTNETHWTAACRLALISRKGPVLLHDDAWLHITQPMLQKSNELGYKVLPHQPYLPNLSPADYHFFKHLNNFLQGKHFHNQQDAENAFQEFIKSQSTDFYYRNK